MTRFVPEHWRQRTLSLDVWVPSVQETSMPVISEVLKIFNIHSAGFLLRSPDEGGYKTIEGSLASDSHDFCFGYDLYGFESQAERGTVIVKEARDRGFVERLVQALVSIAAEPRDIQATLVGEFALNAADPRLIFRVPASGSGFLQPALSGLLWVTAAQRLTFIMDLRSYLPPEERLPYDQSAARLCVQIHQLCKGLRHELNLETDG